MPPSSATAGAHRTSTSTSFLLLHPSATATLIHRKPFLISCTLTPFPSKPIKRKNYLRPKILKTIIKPSPNPLPQSPPANPINPSETPPEQSPNFPFDQFSSEELKLPETHDFRSSEISQSVGVIDGSVGKFSRTSVLKFGLWLVGVFMLQTICAVWLLESANSDPKGEDLDGEDKAKVLELRSVGIEKTKLNFFSNKRKTEQLGLEQGGIAYVYDSDFEEKIDEIREMAREARLREKLESKTNDLEDSDDDDVLIRSGIKKEVDKRLVNLRKMLRKSRERISVSSVSYLGKEVKVENGVDEGGLGVKEVNEALMFKKKFKFRSPSIEPSDKPKGFMGREKHGVSKAKDTSLDSENEIFRSGGVGDNGADLLDKEQQLDLPGSSLQENVPMSLEDESGREPLKEETKSMQSKRKKLGKARETSKLRKAMGVAKPKPGTVILQERRSYESPQVEAVKFGESSKLEGPHSQIFSKDNQNKIVTSDHHNVLSRNGSLNSKKAANTQSANEVGDNRTNKGTDLWWSGLPYVLAIFMCRGHDGEGSKGLFTIRSISQAEGDPSHTLAFEDRSDATNFCYILQSFFEDLGDFSSDVVPLSIKVRTEPALREPQNCGSLYKKWYYLYACLYHC
ncbi:unnamed protein product [Ilex paraguariensis]|uniref:Uncharacterized protein n=1 Tax=Ilex paraguariensis TaxID=185542 RepID=A0ABC8TKU8_9AQUA